MSGYNIRMPSEAPQKELRDVTYADLGKGFIENTTAHGIPHIMGSRGNNNHY